MGEAGQLRGKGSQGRRVLLQGRQTKLLLLLLLLLCWLQCLCLLVLKQSLAHQALLQGRPQSQMCFSVAVVVVVVAVGAEGAAALRQSPQVQEASPQSQQYR